MNFTNKEIDLLWETLSPTNMSRIDGKETRVYYRGNGSHIYVTYEQLVDTVNGSCFSAPQIGADSDVRLFLKYVPLTEVPMFLDNEHPLSTYAKWR